MKKNESSEDLTGSGYAQLARFCENGREPLGSINIRSFLYQLSDYGLFKDDCAPWRKLGSVWGFPRLPTSLILVFHIYRVYRFPFHLNF
jgi:hypothetical protein